MAKILSEKEVNDLLGYAEEGEAKKADNNPESIENSPERERVLTLLHDFYQEQQKNMPVYREIAELAEKLKEAFRKVGLYYNKLYRVQSEITTRICETENLPYRNEVVIQWMQNDEKGLSGVEGVIISLTKILNDELNLEPAGKEEKSEIVEIIENLKNIQFKLNENVKKLWEIRKGVAKELILTIPEFADFKNAELLTIYLDQGLYNLDGKIRADKIFETENGKEEESIFFTLSYLQSTRVIKNLTEKFNITNKN